MIQKEMFTENEMLVGNEMLMENAGLIHAFIRKFKIQNSEFKIQSFANLLSADFHGSYGTVSKTRTGIGARTVGLRTGRLFSRQAHA
jgi:hypothetical protein